MTNGCISRFYSQNLYKVSSRLRVLLRFVIIYTAAEERERERERERRNIHLIDFLMIVTLPPPLLLLCVYNGSDDAAHPQDADSRPEHEKRENKNKKIKDMRGGGRIYIVAKSSRAFTCCI